MSTTSMPIAQASGLPPNVEPCSPGRNTPSTSRFATTADNGMMPPPSALPSTYTSGTTSSWSQANVVPGAAEARLDLVGDQQDVDVGAELARGAQVALGRNDHARLALDRLDEERDGVLVDRLAQRVDVAVGNRLEPRRERSEPGRAPTGRSRSSTIVTVRPWKLPSRHEDLRAIRRHALDVVAPAAGRLDRGLDRLGAGVHREHHVLAGELGEVAAEDGERVVVERARGQRHRSSCGAPPRPAEDGGGRS